MNYAVRMSAIAAPLMVLALSATANAMPPPGAGSAADGTSQIIKVHGCHRSCEWGPALRWHRHVGPLCRPLACYPRAARPNRCWVDAWGVRRCRW